MSIIKVPSKKAKKGYTYKVTFKYKENDITRTYSKSGFIVKKNAQEHESMVKAQINQDGYLKKVCNDSLNKVFNDWLKVDSGLYALIQSICIREFITNTSITLLVKRR